ncbi:MAG: hypothetical protein Q9195_008807 [Heterodermia aff. obscurata]
MARRVTLHDPTTAIKYLREDGGVILTDFSTIDDLEKVNADAAPYIEAIIKDVRPPHRITTRRELVTDAILSAAATLDIGTGVKAQDLHRDEFIWQRTQANKNIRDEYEMGQDVTMGVLIPGIDTCRENGATLVSRL